MLSSKARVETEHASKYLQQLCKHFAHKVQVDYDPHNAKVSFPFGPCELEAVGGHLDMLCQAESEEGLSQMQSVLDQHLAKFAWREELSLDWKRE